MNTHSATAAARTTRTRALSLLTASLVLAAPLASEAQTEAAMDACIKAFVATSLSPGHPIRIQKDAYQPTASYGMSRAITISLTAQGATSGKQLAKATCVVDRSGAVIALNGKPVPAHLAGAPKATETTAAR